MGFGNKLQEIRLRAGMSQSQLAKVSGLSVRNIQNWERSHREPRALALLKLAAALKVPLESLVGELEKEEATPKKKPRGRRKRK